MQTISIDADMVLRIGTITVLIIGALVTFAVELVKRQVYKRMDRDDENRREWQKEQVEDAIRASKGQEVMSDCLNVILSHMIYGNHVESLQQAQRDLQAFREENSEAMRRKAAKYNLR